MRRAVDIVVLSDIHLGTAGCRAEELLKYLHSIKPDYLVLNGDIIDVWQFKKSYFPDNHFKVLKCLLDFAYSGCEVVYITGNHDEMLRKFVPMQFGKIQLVNKLLLNIGGQRTWIFHGDVFDASIQHAKWLAKLGGWGYDRLIQLNTWINFLLVKMGREKYSLSKRIKNSVKKAVKFISDFEKTASELAIENRYDYVICGHIHHPSIREFSNKKGSCVYMNSGDWIENLSALEFKNKEWKIFCYEEHKHLIDSEEPMVYKFNDSIEDLLANILKADT